MQDSSKKTVDISGLDEPLQVRAGDHNLVVTGKNFETKSQSFTVRHGKNTVVHVELIPKAVAAKIQPLDKAPPSLPGAGEPQAQTDGFVSLFNGNNLLGWKIPEGDNGHWKVKDGVIDYDARSEAKRDKDLWSEKSYRDFILLVDWRLKTEPGFQNMVPIILPDGSHKKDKQGKEIRVSIEDVDSGIYLRDTGHKAQVNIWMWPIGSGEVHDYRTDRNMPPEVRAGATPKKKADRPRGEWNTFEITMKGDRLTVKLNGEEVISNAQLPGIPAEGPIGLQHHGNSNPKTGRWTVPPSLVQFRNLYIKELPATQAVAPVQSGGAWTPLFNGKDRTGWKTHPAQPGNWRVENGILIGSGPTRSHLYTERDHYKDFHLRVEARINDDGNSGLYFRTPFGPAWPANNPTWLLGYNAKINNSRYATKTGGLFVGDENPPVVDIRESLVPLGEWLTLEVIAQGNHIVIKVNGKTTADYTDEKRRFTQGHIALQQHTGQTVVEFRKIEIKELPSAGR